jgi:hypothetical protein
VSDGGAGRPFMAHGPVVPAYWLRGRRSLPPSAQKTSMESRYRVISRDAAVLVRLAGPFDLGQALALLRELEALKAARGLRCLVWDTRRRTTSPELGDVLEMVRSWERWSRVAVIVGTATQFAMARMAAIVARDRIFACRDTHEAIGWIRGQIERKDRLR